MRPSVGTLAVGLLAACVISCASAAAAPAQIPFTPCEQSNQFACAHLTVPLDPSGHTPGTVTLAMQRHRAAVGEAHSAIIALAGGPGQPALGFAEEFAELLGPIAATRDLIVFDQRGIGYSGALACHAFERPDLFHNFGQLLATCAAQLGPERSFYTTADTVADIEAIRQAGGYEKLVLYGTSYGTKVAEQYAQEYPSHVEALILDSVVPPNGPEPLNRSTFAAIPRVLKQVCAASACLHVTSNPLADLTRVIARADRAPLRGQAVDGAGKTHRVTISAGGIFELLLDGDFSQVLRANLVTATAAAARGDTAPLARLLYTTGGEGEGGEDFDTPLYYATSCEEQLFPWNRSSSPAKRLSEARRAAKALGASAFAPFSTSNALELSDIPGCAYWPFPTTPPPSSNAPLPNIPTMILSGADDLRTPTANAREVAAQIPDAHLLVVPYTGHSVLTTEPTQCASEALQALFASHAIKACAVTPAAPLLRPPPLPPLRIDELAPAGGYSGLPGRTLQAVSLTLGDALRQLVLTLPSFSGSVATASVGGLRSGWVRDAGGTLTFHDDSYIPGVTISGKIGLESAVVHVDGPAAAHGTLRLGPNKALIGALGAKHVTLPATSIASTAIVGTDAQTSSHAGDRRASAIADIRQLTRLLRWIHP